MMNRRKFFGFLPASLFGLAAVATAEPTKAKDDFDWDNLPQMPIQFVPNAEPSLWVELTCQAEPFYDKPEQMACDQWDRLSPGLKKVLGVRSGRPECGQKFKALRIPISPVCPKCGYRQDISQPGIRDKLMGIPC